MNDEWFWTHVVVEGYCLAPNNRCHRKPDARMAGYQCLRRYDEKREETIEYCPHFHWGDSSEREAAIWVPLPLLIWDKIWFFLREKVWIKLYWGLYRGAKERLFGKEESFLDKLLEEEDETH